METNKKKARYYTKLCLTLVGKRSWCRYWNAEVAWLDGNSPWSWKSCMTKCLLWSRVRLRELGRPEDDGVVGEDRSSEEDGPASWSAGGGGGGAEHFFFRAYGL